MILLQAGVRNIDRYCYIVQVGVGIFHQWKCAPKDNNIQVKKKTDLKFYSFNPKFLLNLIIFITEQINPKLILAISDNTNIETSFSMGEVWVKW